MRVPLDCTCAEKKTGKTWSCFRARRASSDWTFLGCRENRAVLLCSCRICSVFRAGLGSRRNSEGSRTVYCLRDWAPPIVSNCQSRALAVSKRCCQVSVWSDTWVPWCVDWSSWSCCFSGLAFLDKGSFGKSHCLARWYYCSTGPVLKAVQMCGICSVKRRGS